MTCALTQRPGGALQTGLSSSYQTAGVLPLTILWLVACSSLLSTGQPWPLCRHQWHHLVTVVPLTFLMAWTPGLLHAENRPPFLQAKTSCQMVTTIDCCRLNQLLVCKEIFWDANHVVE